MPKDTSIMVAAGEDHDPKVGISNESTKTWIVPSMFSAIISGKPGLGIRCETTTNFN